MNWIVDFLIENTLYDNVTLNLKKLKRFKHRIDFIYYASQTISTHDLCFQKSEAVGSKNRYRHYKCNNCNAIVLVRYFGRIKDCVCLDISYDNPNNYDKTCNQLKMKKVLK